MNKNIVIVLTSVVFAACGGESILRPLPDASPSADAGRVTVCEPGENRACYDECFGTTERAEGTQYCNSTGEWDRCVIEWDCPARREPPTQPDAAVPPVADAAPDATPPIPPTVPPLVEVEMDRIDSTYRRADLQPSNERPAALGTLLVRQVDSRVSELRATFHVVPDHGSRIVGSRGSQYIGNPGVPGDVNNGYQVLGSGVLQFEVTFPVAVRSSSERPLFIPVNATVSDWEDAADEFTTRVSTYHVELADLMVRLVDGPWVRGPSSNVIIREANGRRTSIEAVDVPTCGAAPMPELLRPMEIGYGFESVTSQLYEVEVRPSGRSSITSGGLMLLVQNDAGIFFPSATSVGMMTRGSSRRGDQMADWMACERRRGHITSMRYRFTVERNRNFALNGSFQAENADTYVQRLTHVGDLNGVGGSPVCTPMEDSFPIRRCTGDRCDDDLVISELHPQSSDVAVRYAFGMPLVEQACLYRTFLRR